VNAAAFKVNPALLVPVATTTDKGAERTPLTIETPTLAPPASAFLVNVTVQVLDALGARVAGAQSSEETNTGATRLIVSLAELLL
jgi:hypothetical protein